ncbi:heterocyst-inhibiting protein PatX [Calothrix sp. PCC 7507]|uniref:heterocyst-inhibiting protein PatX n=1 Tax=Calothrix sp. PCC 7507 TaxID=99598 RepID=UPI00029ED743|nr:hypothetical protein [Calothrix sp. PCC 7507]AFY35931.1 hypothetical protein Cal7507_5605 [Calothrix sp. PCC 7507]
MRAAISLLVSSLVFGSLAFNYQGMANQLSRQMLASSGSEELLSVRPKPKPNQPEKPAPHRGSGRRELMEYYGNNHLAV